MVPIVPLGRWGDGSPGRRPKPASRVAASSFGRIAQRPPIPGIPASPGGLDVGQTLLNSHASSQTHSTGPGPQQARDRGTNRGQSVASTTEEDPEDLVRLLRPRRLSRKPGESGL